MDTLKLTKPIVESLLSPTGRSKNGVLLKYAIHWDTELKGFGLRITVNGVKTFVLQHRVNGKDRRLTIGRFGPLTAEEARREARKLLGAIATGRDPVAERRQAACDAVTLGETFADYLRARSELRPKTVKDYERIMRASFGDWRKRPLLDISGDMVQKRHTALAEHHGKAWATCRCGCCGRSTTLPQQTTRGYGVVRWSWTTRSSACHGSAHGIESTAARH